MQRQKIHYDFVVRKLTMLRQILGTQEKPFYENFAAAFVESQLKIRKFLADLSAESSSKIASNNQRKARASSSRAARLPK